MEELFNKTTSKIVDLVRNGSFEEAEQLCNQALKVFDDIVFKQYLGICYIGLQKYEEAKIIFEENIKNADLSADYNNLCIVMRFLKRYEESYLAGVKAITLTKDNPSFYGNLATTAKILAKDVEALELITKAVALNPDNCTFWFDKGAMHFSIGDIKNAEICYRSGLRINKQHEKYFVELFYAMGLQNKFPEAWKYYEYRYNTMPQVNNIIKKTNLEVLLEKKDFYPEKILISFEQGHGDNMMYLRFLPEFQKKAPNSYLLVQDSCFKKYVEEIGVKSSDKILDGTEKILCMMSLPYHLDIISIPPPIVTNKHTPTASNKLKVGICYAGSALHPMDYQRSTPLNWYDVFIQDQEIECYSFVKDRRPRIHKETQKVINYSEGFEDYKIVDLSKGLTDVDGTMNQLNKIDVLVTVDTFVAHIAGTMGVPTYLILSNLPDWRWGLKENETQWYPSFKIFRQKDDMKKVILEVYGKIRSEFIAPYSER